MLFLQVPFFLSTKNTYGGETIPLYNFDRHQDYTSIESVPDFRSDADRTLSPLSIYNQQKPDIGYAERMAQEIVNISGAPVIIFKRTRNIAKRDDIYDEDADPTYERGIVMKGYFSPQPAESQLTKWGVDTPNTMTINFSRSDVLGQFGERMIADGDIIIAPHNTLIVTTNTDLYQGIGNRMDRFRVIKANDTGNFHYRWLYWSCILENLTGDKSIDVVFSKERA